MRVALPSLDHLPWYVRWRVRLSWAIGFRLTANLRLPEYDHAGSFNLGVGTVGIWFPAAWGLGYVPIWPYNAFNRVYEEPEYNCWGLGVLQVGGRHLLSVVSNEEKFQVDVLFVHVVNERPRPNTAKTTEER